MADHELKVLLIEDSAVHAELIRILLRDASDARFVVEWAETLSSGLDMLQSQQIDVVLLDLGVGDSEGLVTFQRVYDCFPAVPVVILTATDDERLAFEALEQGCQDYLVKGKIDAASLRRSLRFAVERHLRRQLEASLRATEKELQMAREIQNRLRPQQEHRLPGYDLAGTSHPAAETCGDFFDFFPLGDDCFGFVVGDVCGHGLGPALLAAQARTYLRSLALAHDNIGEILTVANRLLADDLKGNRFVTAFFAKLHLPTCSLAFAGAGQRAYWVDMQGQVVHLDSTCAPLGLYEDLVSPEVKELLLQPGELLLVPSDGLFDAVNGEFVPFGPQRVFDIISQRRTEPARLILESLIRKVRAFAQGAPQIDDITAVLLRVDASFCPDLGSVPQHGRCLESLPMQSLGFD